MDEELRRRVLEELERCLEVQRAVMIDRTRYVTAEEFGSIARVHGLLWILNVDCTTRRSPEAKEEAPTWLT